MSELVNNCQRDLIAAYVDGELETAARSLFEEHVATCRSCSDELLIQRRLMCELDSAFSQPFPLDVPQNFAELVAVRAKSDMSGARSGQERRRAVAFSLILAAGAFALLGAAAGRSIVSAAELLTFKLVGVAGLLGKALYDAAAGLSVILRVAGGALLPDSFAVLVFLLLMLAVLLLSILIISYHRFHHRGLTNNGFNG